MNNLSTREAYGQALAELGDLRDDIVVLDADLSKSTKTVEFAKKFPTRFFNMGIAEQNLIGAACGLSTTGKIPFVSTFAVFATGRGFEIIRNSVCYPNLNVKICATHAGITVGEDGASHQSIEDISIMRSIPNMTVLVPADGVEAKKMIFEVAKYKGFIVDIFITLVLIPSDFNDILALTASSTIIPQAIIVASIPSLKITPLPIWKSYGLTADNIVEKVKETIKHK